MYGPKGIGALYIRRKPRVKLEAILSGGGQERGLRSGTLAPVLAVGMGEAARFCREDMEFDSKWIDYLSGKLKK
jgi:cysteine desulfurase